MTRSRRELFSSSEGRVLGFFHGRRRMEEAAGQMPPTNCRTQWCRTRSTERESWPTFGLQMIEELAGLGYKVSPGTMYPLLQALEKKGVLRSTEVRREPRTGGVTLVGGHPPLLGRAPKNSWRRGSHLSHLSIPSRLQSAMGNIVPSFSRNATFPSTNCGRCEEGRNFRLWAPHFCNLSPNRSSQVLWHV
jgi:hypothetical protein